MVGTLGLLTYLFCEGVSKFFVFVFGLLVGGDSAGSEVADEQLQQVEADEICGDIVGSRSYDVDVGGYEETGGSPPEFAEADELIDQ